MYSGRFDKNAFELISMLVLMDESGCTGFKPASSTHFVTGAIIFDSFYDAEECANMINKLKKEIGQKREFRFSSCDIRRRDLFFATIRKAKFKVRLFVVEKRLIHSDELRKNDEKFANYCTKCLMKDGAHRIKDAVVKIDGKGSKAFKKAALTICVGKCRREPSKTLSSATQRKTCSCSSQI